VEHIVDIATDESVRRLRRFYEDPQPYFEQILSMLPPHLRKHVTATGSVSRDAVAREIREADILVNPSLSETFGMALVEAMASGVPVISTRVGGMPEVIEDGVTGLLIPPDDPASLAHAIQALLRDPARRQAMGAAGRERALNHYTWEAVASQTGALYRSLLAGEAIAFERHTVAFTRTAK
jgi:glycosyltransferase involved in cell wall biosynthesis